MQALLQQCTVLLARGETAAPTRATLAFDWCGHACVCVHVCLHACARVHSMCVHAMCVCVCMQCRQGLRRPRSSYERKPIGSPLSVPYVRLRTTACVRFASACDLDKTCVLLQFQLLHRIITARYLSVWVFVRRGAGRPSWPGARLSERPRGLPRPSTRLVTSPPPALPFRLRQHLYTLPASWMLL